MLRANTCEYIIVQFHRLAETVLNWLYFIKRKGDIFIVPICLEVKMRIPLDRQSVIPLYQQIKTYLRKGILSGSLAADTRLPASRFFFFQAEDGIRDATVTGVQTCALPI